MAPFVLKIMIIRHKEIRWFALDHIAKKIVEAEFKHKSSVS